MIAILFLLSSSASALRYGTQGLVTTIGVWAAVWLISYLLREDEESPEKRKGATAVARTAEGVAIPLAFGHVRIDAPLVAWAGNYSSRGGGPITTPGGPPPPYELITANIQLLICLSNIPIDDTSDQAQAQLVTSGVWFDGIRNTPGTWNTLSEAGQPPGVSTANVSINLGSAAQQVYGLGEFNAGRWDTDNGIWALQAFAAAGVNADYAPPYQGVVTMMLSGGLGHFAGPIQVGMVLGSGQSFPLPAIQLVNPCTIPGGVPLYMEMNNGDANPAAVIYRILTGGWGGRSISPSLIDIDSFNDAAETLYLEQNGTSGVVYSSTAARNTIRTLLAQIEGSLEKRGDTGLLTLYLVREIPDLGDLEVIDRHRLSRAPELLFTTYADTSNAKRITFTNRSKDFREDQVIVHDQANFEVTGSRRDEDETFPWVTNRENATKIGWRLLRAASLPLASAKLAVKRDTTIYWFVGKPFIYEHPTNSKSYVMRVVRADVGPSTDGEVVVDAVQDRWTYGLSVRPPEETGPPASTFPFPPPAQVVTELPYWLLPDESRLLYLAAPPTNSFRYQGLLDIAGDAFDTVEDCTALSYVGTATLVDPYARTLEPDDAAGFQISDTTWTPESATTSEIQFDGRNLLMISDGTTEEILAFRTANDLGGGIFQLEDIERGLLDTSPQDHAAGAAVYLIEPRTLRPLGAENQFIGRTPVARGDAASTWISPGGVPISDLAQHDLTVRARSLLPARVADLEIAGTKSGLTVLEDGVALTWRRRSRTALTVVRGGEADFSVDTEGTTYTILATTEDDDEVEIVAGVTAAGRPLTKFGKAGHGLLEVGVRGQRTLPVGDAVTSWQDTMHRATFPIYRNLLAESRLDQGLVGWTSVSDPLEAVAAGPYLDYDYVYGASGSADIDWSQDVDVSGYRPGRMRAVLRFKARQFSDTEDQVEVDLLSLDAVGGATLDTDSSGTITPSSTQWGQHELDIPVLDADTLALRVRFVQIDRGGIGQVRAAVADPVLLVGQFTDQLLANAPLAGTGSWTTATGSFSTETTTPALGASYVRSGANTANTLTQTVSLPAGYAYGKASIRVGARANTASYAGTITVRVEALNAGASVIATSDKIVTELGAAGWVPLTSTLDLPGATASIKISLRASAPTTANRIDWNDAHLRVHKDLRARQSLTLDFSQPYLQELPNTPYRWADTYDVADLPVPTWGWFAGRASGVLSIEPEMRAETGVYLSEINTPARTQAYEFRGDGALFRSRSDTHWGNRTTAQAFTVRVVYASLDTTGDHGLCGRMGATGWKIDVAGYVPRVILDGTLATVTVEAPASTPVGGPTYVAVSYDPAAEELSIRTPAGTNMLSTAGLGEMTCDELIPFCIGSHTRTSPDTMVGTIARVEMWNEALDLAAFASAWGWGSQTWDDGGGAIVDYYPAASSAVACIVGSDDDGVLVGEFPLECPGLWAVVGGQTGLPLSSGRDNLVAPNPNLSTSWSLIGTGAATLSAARAPSGRTEAVAITGSSLTGGRARAVSLPASTFVSVSFMARANVAVTSQVVARLAGALAGSASFSVGTTWQRVDLSITLSSAADELVWYPHATATSTIYIAGPLFVDQSSLVPPIAIPLITSDAESSLNLGGIGLDLQHHHEGEIEAQVISLSSAVPTGTLARLVAASGGDHQCLYLDSGLSKFDHRNGAGVSTISGVTETSFSSLRTIRGRWSVDGLLDGASSFAGVVSEAGEDFARTATWAPGSGSYDTLEIGQSGGADQPGLLLVNLTVRAREKIL